MAGVREKTWVCGVYVLVPTQNLRVDAKNFQKKNYGFSHDGMEVVLADFERTDQSADCVAATIV